MGTCERLMRVEAPADVVWKWMTDPKNLFSVNMLHAEVLTDETELRFREWIEQRRKRVDVHARLHSAILHRGDVGGEIIVEGRIARAAGPRPLGVQLGLGP